MRLRAALLGLFLLLPGGAVAAAEAGWAQAHLAAAVHEIEPTLRRWGYPAIAGVVALDYVGVPLPADTMLVAATVASTRGDLDLGAVYALAVVAMILGSQAGFALGRWGGRALLERLPIPPAHVAKVEDRYRRWGTWVVLVAPFIDGLRQLNALAAGMLGMGWWRFTAVNAVAALIWAAAWIGAAFLVADHVAGILPSLQTAKPWLYLAALAALAVWLWRAMQEPARSTSR